MRSKAKLQQLAKYKYNVSIVRNMPSQANQSVLIGTLHMPPGDNAGSPICSHLRNEIQGTENVCLGKKDPPIPFTPHIVDNSIQRQFEN